MLCNYHTHTHYCGHGVGDPVDYAKTGFERGLKELGFSEHVPYSFSTGYHSTIRVQVEDAAQYMELCRAEQKRYEGRMKIFVGFEAEYYPGEFGELIGRLQELGCEYLILGQHATENEYDGVWTRYATEDRTVLSRYVNQVLDGLQTGRYSYLAHPDLMRFSGDLSFYREEAFRLCREVKACGLPLELNLVGVEEHRWYPRDEFWEVVAEVGNEVILGCDAHRPDQVADPDIEKAGLAYLDRFGLTPIPSVRLVDPFR